MKFIVVLLSVLIISGCVAVPVFPDYAGIDAQPNVIYSQPYYNPIVINRYPRYGYRHHQPYKYNHRPNHISKPRYNHNRYYNGISKPRPHIQSQRFYTQ